MTIFVRTTRTGPGYLLELDPAICAARLGRCAMRMRHHLTYHPLLTLEAIADLAGSLPDSAIEHFSVAQNGASDKSQPRPSVTASESFLGIDTPGSWVMIKNIKMDAQYGRLLDEEFDLLDEYLPAREGGMGQREGFLFVTAPGAIRPVRMCSEHHALLQIRGTEQVRVGTCSDRSAGVNPYLYGGERELADIPPNANSCNLQPGEALYIPPWYPHVAKNGPTVSITLLLAFSTWPTEDGENLDMLNGNLRCTGQCPQPSL